jgi:uncharacterized protein YneF (UPF0154 family)
LPVWLIVVIVVVVALVIIGALVGRSDLQRYLRMRRM